MKKKINIIQFLPYFPPHKWGVEIVWEEIWKYWIKNKLWNFINIVSDFEQTSPPTPLLQGEGSNIIFKWEIIWYKKDWYEVLVIPSFEIINNFPVYKIWDKKYKLIIKYLEDQTSPHQSPLEERELEQNYRVITHTRFFLTSLIWWLFARKNMVKWIHIEHGSDFVKLSSKLKSSLSIIYDKIIWKWIFKKSDKILAISEASKNFIINNFLNRKIEVFYRGLDLSNISINKQLPIKLCFIWRLVTLKWVGDLIEVYKKIWLKNELIIIWDWEEKEKLKEESKWFNIKFLWYKDRKFILDFISKNNIILINPSYQEWMPTTVIEWLSTWSVVIASDVWWTSEISNKDDLVLFKAWDLEWLNEKIIFVLDNYDLLNWLSFELIKEKFNRDNNIFSFCDLIR